MSIVAIFENEERVKLFLGTFIYKCAKIKNSIRNFAYIKTTVNTKGLTKKGHQEIQFFAEKGFFNNNIVCASTCNTQTTV
jgi:hypothetical protein